MKKRKLFIILFVIFIILVSSVSIFFLSRQKSAHRTSSAISRFEWMQLLGDYFGINEPTQVKSMWSDIEKNSPYLKYIQAATEWDIISQEDEFHGEDAVTGSFMAKTALKAVGEDLLGLYAQKQGRSSGNAYIDLLIQENLLKETELQEDISEKRAKEFLADISDFYQSTLRCMNAENIDYKDGVPQIPEKAILSMDKQIEKVTLKNEYVSNLKEGDFIVLHTVRGMLAKKITKIENQNQLSLEHADLDKVINSIVISENVSAGFEDIAKAYGAEIIDLNDTSKNGLRAEKDSYQVQPLGVLDYDFEKEINNKGFEIDFSLSYDGDKENMSVTMTDHNTNRFCEIQPPKEEKGHEENSVSKEGYIRAKIDVTRIYLSAFVSMSGIIPQKVDLSSAVEGSVSYATGGKINFKKKIISCPLYGAGSKLGLNLNIYLILGMDGSLRIKTDVSNNQGVIYEKGKGIRKVNSQTNSSMEEPTIETSVEADIAVTPGIEFQPTIMINDENLFDVEIDISAELKEAITTRQNGMICEERSIAFPLFHIGVLEDDGIITNIAEKFGQDISAGWDIITADNAPFKKQGHHENGEEVPECTYKFTGNKEENKDKEVVPESNKYLHLKEVIDYKFSSGRQYLVAPFEETWEGFKTKIEIYYYPSIGQEKFRNLKEGDSFTVLGRKYTVGKSYQKFIQGKGGADKNPKTGKEYSDEINPHGCCEIFDDEGHTYYIPDLQNPMNTQKRVDNDYLLHYDSFAPYDLIDDYWFCDINGMSVFRSETVDTIIVEDAKIYLTSYKDDDKAFDPDKAFTARRCAQSPLKDRFGNEIANCKGSIFVDLKLNNAGFIKELRPIEAG